MTRLLRLPQTMWVATDSTAGDGGKRCRPVTVFFSARHDPCDEWPIQRRFVRRKTREILWGMGFGHQEQSKGGWFNRRLDSI